MDEWGIDICATASQKCLEAPPGLALVSVSEKALEHMKARKVPISGWALNLLKWKEWADKGRDTQPYYLTMAVNNVVALRKSLESILEEGLPARFARHKAVGDAFRQGLRELGLKPLGTDAQASGIVGVFSVPEGHKDSEIVSFMKDEYGIQIAGGLGKLSGKTVRVGHMGPGARMARIVPVLHGLEQWIK